MRSASASRRFFCLYFNVSAAAGQLRLSLKITLGGRLYLALAGLSALAVLLASPLGLLKNEPDYVREYSTLAFSELFLPLQGLLVSYGSASQGQQMIELIYQRPGGEAKKAVPILRYLGGTGDGKRETRLYWVCRTRRKNL